MPTPAVHPLPSPRRRLPASTLARPGLPDIADDPLAVLTALVRARQACDTRRSPALAAELDRRLDRAALAFRPPLVVARAAAESDRPLTSPPVRAWLARVLRLPSPTVLLVLARARWLLPVSAPTRLAIARALLAGLDRPGRPLDIPLRALVLASPVIDAANGPVLGRGLTAYAARDDLTAVHLLVPRLEAVLHGLARRLAAAEVASAPACGLDGLLRHPPLRQVLGEGLTEYLRAVLVTDSGLRHRLAHGRLPPAACTRRVARDVVLCYLRLSRLPAPGAGLPPTTGGSHAGPATRRPPDPGGTSRR